jgi:dual specificity tyrosine-phosphorylation-regulated kinase 2/3/4
LIKKKGYPIFPGENEEEQMSMIMEVIDLPPIHVLEQGTRTKIFFGKNEFFY